MLISGAKRFSKKGCAHVDAWNASGENDTALTVHHHMLSSLFKSNRSDWPITFYSAQVVNKH